MCQKCVDCCRELDIPEDRWSDFLMSATPFPFQDWPDMGKSIRSIWERSGHDVDVAIALAHQDMDKAMDDFNRREREEARIKLCEGAD